MLLESIFINVLSSFIYDLKKEGFREFLKKSPIQAAIHLTASDFPSQEIISDALARWSESDAFINQIELLSKTIEEVNIEGLTDSFIDVGKFYDSIHILRSKETALEILTKFFTHFESELYKTEHAPYIDEQKSKLRHREVRIDLEQIRQQNSLATEDIKETVSENFRMLSERLQPVVDIEAMPAVKEKVHFAEVDFAVQLMKKSKPKLALDKLLELRTAIERESLSIDLLFRVIANIGLCSFHLEDFEHALEQLERANSLKPSDPLVLSHLALLHSIKGENELAVEYALKSWPDTKNASVVACNYLRVMHGAGNEEKIADFVNKEPWVKTDANGALALGLIAFDRKDFVEAEDYFRFAHSIEPSNPHSSRLLAQTIIVPIDNVILNDPPLFLSEEIINRLNEAQSYLSEAIIIFEHQEGAKDNLTYSLLQRAYVRGLLGDTLKAIDDYSWLTRISPENDEVIRQKGQALLFNDKVDEALSCFNQIKSDSVKKESILSVALAFSKKNDYQSVLATLQRNNNIISGADLSVDSRYHLLFLDLLLAAYHFLAHIEELSSLLVKLKERHSGEPEVLAIIGKQLVREEKFEEAFSFYQKAISTAGSVNQRKRLSIELADQYLKAGQWSEAASFYSGNLDTDFDGELTRSYVVSLYNSGSRDKAFDIVTNLRNGGGAIPFLSRIEADVLMVLNRHEEALELYQQLSHLEPQNLSHQLAIVAAYHFGQEFDQARQVVENIQVGEFEKKPEMLMRIAAWRRELDMTGAMPLAYEARKLGLGSAEIHNSYISLFMNLPNKEQGVYQDTETVSVDCAVFLENHRKDIVVYLIVDNHADISRGEIAVNDRRAKKLIGLKKGSVVTFNEGEPTEHTFKVVDIKHKYLYAFQETIKRYEEWFGSSASFAVIDTDEHDLSNFLKLLSDRRQHTDALVQKYQGGLLPLATFARAIGKSLFETWLAVTERGDLPLLVTTGNADVVAHEAGLIKSSNSIVIDVTGLLTLALLEQLDNLPKAFESILISNAVAGKFKEWEVELKNAKPHPIVWEADGQYHHHEVTQEEIELRSSMIGRIVEFIDNYTKLTPASKVLTIPHEKLDKFNSYLGPSFTSILLSAEYDLPVYTDDFNAVGLSASEGWNANRISSQSILLKFKSRGLINLVEYYSALKKIISRNYVYISIDAKFLLWVFRDEKKLANDVLKKILHSTIGPHCDPKSSVIVGAHFSRLIFLENLDSDEREKVIALTLDAIYAGKDTLLIANLIKDIFPNVFKYLPERLVEILAVARAIADRYTKVGKG